MGKMPEWLPEAIATAEVADKIALSMDEVSWLRERIKRGKGPWHPRVVWLFLKSNYRLWKRNAQK